MLQLVKKGLIDNSTELSLILENPTTYIPKIYMNCISYLKKGCVVWIKKEEGVYDVYELTQCITESNASEFVRALKDAVN